MSVKPILEMTADGSHTLFVPELNEHYHSTNGAVQEAGHVFINAGLHHSTKNEIKILEVGFGTGLNAFLTLLDVQKSGKRVHYITLEAYPLSMEIIRNLNYPNLFSANNRESYYRLHEAEWGKEIEINPDFYLTKVNADFTRFDFSELTDTIDIVYFDAFAPDKQSEMWTQSLFDQLYNSCVSGGIFVTYCAKGVVRRMLQQSGFVTERLPGPPGKREMLRATKQIG